MRMRTTRLFIFLALLLGLAAGASAQPTSLYYVEEVKDGRVYVFNTPEAYKEWKASNDMGKAITLIASGEGGMTVVAENETAADLYFFKHNLPGYDRPTPKPVTPPKYPATKIQGRFYGDFTDKQIENKGTSTKSGDTGVGVDVKRFYFTVTHQIDETWSAQFQSDIGDKGTKRYDVFVKKAYLQAKLSDAASIRVGAADTPWIPFAESVYGLRYFEQTITDSLGFGTSSDWGVHLLGNLAGGKVGYQVSAVNGKGYSNPDRSKSVDFEGRLSFKPFSGFTLGIGGYSGKLGNDVETNSPAKHTAQRLNALAAYSTDTFGIGVEYFSAKNYKNVTSAATDKADGFSVFANVTPADSWKVFARYDTANPSKDINDKLELTYYNLGVEHRFNKSVAISLAYKYAEGKGGTIGTGNGTVGSAVAGKKGTYNEVGFWAIYDF